MSALAERCWALHREGRLTEAVAVGRQALRQAEASGEGIGAAAGLLGRLLALELQHHDAAPLLARAARELPRHDHAARGTVFLELARSLERLGRFREADVAWTQAQASQELAGDAAQLARILCQRSLSAVHRGRHHAALALLEQAWEGPVLRDGAREHEANVLAHLADVRGRLGLVDEALASMARAVALIRANHGGDDLVWVLNTAGDVHRRAGDWEGAQAAYDEALAIAETHAPGRAVVVRFNRALLFLEAGAWDRADPGELQVPWREAFPVVVQLALVAARARRADTVRHLYRAERLLQVQPLADVDLATALRIAAERCEAAGWPALAMRTWRLVHGQAEGLDDGARVAQVRDAAIRLGASRGQTLLGDHRLVSRLGAGAMGVVWRARHVQEDREVAIKVLTDQGAGHAGLTSALRAEGRALARLRHSRIVRVIDVGTVDPVAAWASQGDLVAGSPYVVMSLAAGPFEPGALRGRWPAVKGVLEQVLGALAHAHARGLLHLDVKPENLLDDGSGGVLLTDFGLAHALGAQARRGISGSPWYMAPEQIARGQAPLGPATDLYAVGGLATVLATGRPPFAYSQVQQLFEAHLHELPAALRLGPGWPEGFDGWRLGLLAKDHRSRPASAAQALADLRALDGAGPPALPDWRVPVGAAGGPRVFSGLALIEHRTPPLVGRDDVLDALWQALDRVRRTGHSAVVHLTGPPGVGRSALVRALTWRIRELGVARALLHPVQGRGEVEGLRSALVGGGVSLVEGAPWSWARAASALGELLAVGPVLWALDDLHRDDTWVDALTRWLPLWVGQPLLLLGTGLDGASSPALEALLDRVGASRIALGPLDRGALSRAIQGLAPLSPSLVGRVAEASQGNPGRAVTLVRHHVQSGGLVPGPDGYTLDGDLLAGVALDTEGAWAASVQRRLGSVDASTWHALERLACGEGGLAGPDLAALGLEDAATLLQRRGLASLRGDRLQLPWATRELLLARARAGGRLQEHHTAWAAAVGEGRPGICGAHWLAAGRPAQAAPLLVAAADVAVRAADLVSGARWLRLAQQAAQETGLPETDPTARDLVLVRIRRCQGAGDFQSGLLQARKLVQTLDPQVDPLRAAQALVLLARLEHGDRDPAAGERHARAALALARTHGLGEVHVDAASALFERLCIDGRLPESEALLAEAEAALGDAPEPYARALLQTTRARLSLHLSDFLDVLLRYRELLEQPFVQGNARFEGAAHLAMGEVHRLRGDPVRALRSYDRAEALLADSGAAMGWLPRLNRVLLLIAQGEHHQARAQAERCWHTAVQLGLTGILPPAAALVIRHRAGEPDDRAFREALRELTDAARSGGASEADYVDLMRAGADAALAIGRPDRARQLWRLTAIVLRQLDRDDEARALAQELAGQG